MAIPVANPCFMKGGSRKSSTRGVTMKKNVLEKKLDKKKATRKGVR